MVWPERIPHKLAQAKLPYGYVATSLGRPSRVHCQRRSSLYQTPQGLWNNSFASQAKGLHKLHQTSYSKFESAEIDIMKCNLGTEHHNLDALWQSLPQQNWREAYSFTPCSVRKQSTVKGWASTNWENLGKEETRNSCRFHLKSTPQIHKLKRCVFMKYRKFKPLND